jgi:diguanylate cyclase (GGDEF)-like protein/PAS domain S-box-containing protein
MFTNSSIYEQFGVPIESLKEDFYQIADYVHPEDLPVLLLKFKNALENLSEFQYTWRMTTLAHEEIWVECRTIPKPAGDGATLWYGYIQDVTHTKQTEAQNLLLINYLEKLDQVNRAIQSNPSLNDMVIEVLNTLLSVFQCEQAVLVYPCDPNTEIMEHLFTVADPALSKNYQPIRENISASFHAKDAYSLLLEANTVLSGTPRHHEMKEEPFLPFPLEAQTFMATAIKPKLGQAWMLAVHQCTEKREWQADEKQLLDEIGTRLSEVLVSLIAKRDLASSEERFRQMADSIEEVFWLIDSDVEHFGLLYVSPGFEKIWGFSPQELYNDPYRWWDAVPDEDQFAQRQLVEFYLDKNRASDEIEIEYRVRNTDGSMRHVREKVFVVRNKNGDVHRFAGIAIDVTQKKKQAAQIEHLAYHDALTGLDNRSSIIERLKREIYICETSSIGLAVLFVDLDNFKSINDSLGHLAGDQLLEKVGHKLNRIKGEDNFIGRVGGDEFIILVRNVDSPKAVANIAKTILKALERPFMIHDHELLIGASIGISMCPRDSGDAQTLIRYADNALYAAKEQSANRIRFFSPELDAKIRARLHMETDLRHAIARDELSLNYQVQVNVETNKVSGVEALLRWRHPVFGPVSPADFIPIAEESGLIISIGEWVLEQACIQARKWKQLGLDDLVVSVNISRKQLDEKKFASSIRNILRNQNCPPENIELEITESSAMSNPKRAIKKLKVISDMGVQLALDDFGTGYSNLAYLKRFPFDRLKIDQSFVSDIPNDSDDAAIVQTIILLAKQLRLKVIAEGVEQQQQEQFLFENGCSEMQGYLYSRPVEADKATHILLTAQKGVEDLSTLSKN